MEKMKSLYNLSFVVLMASCLWACTKKTTEEKKEASATVKSAYELELTPAQEKNAILDIGKITGQFKGSQLKLTGYIDVAPSNRVTVSAPLGGYISNLQLLPGAAVSRGQRLVNIQNAEFIKLQQDYLTAKAQLNFTRQDLERQKALNKEQASSDKVFQKANADYAVQQALVASYARQLRSVNINPDKVTPNNITGSSAIYSPITGTVHAVLVNPGKYVNPSDVLFEIVNQNEKHLALKVFEKDLGKLYPGQPIIAYTNNYPDLQYAGNIVLVDKVLDDTRSAVVHCHLRNADNSLVPGMYMNALVQLEAGNHNSLPEDAIVTWEGKQYVFVKESPGQYRMTEIEIGNRVNNEFEVKADSALLQKDLVLKGAYTLLMALKNISDE